MTTSPPRLSDSAPRSTDASPRSVVRQALPVVLVLLAVAASVLTAAPWLRAFPVSFAGAPLFGASVLSVLVPLIAGSLRPRRVALGVLVDVLAFVIFTLLAVLREPTGFAGLVEGIYRGPSQLLSYALPLVGSRGLLVAPVALIWLAGALAGECLARRWFTLLPYLGFVVAFGLGFAGTQRAVPGADQVRATLLAGGLLLALSLLRAVHVWVHQDRAAETTQADGVLPLRGLAAGVATTLVVVLGASLAVQADAFPRRASVPARVPPIASSDPVTPISFVAGLRPDGANSPKRALFSVAVDHSTPGYFPIATLDSYDGAGWTFDRTFRPSGGTVPADADPDLRAATTVTQRYEISSDVFAGTPWLPALDRPAKITGTGVTVDTDSGMVLPSASLAPKSAYTVTSAVDSATFAELHRTAVPDSATSVVDSELPPALQTTLDRLVQTFSRETGVPTSPAVPFLQALEHDLSTRYTLSNAAAGSASGPAATSSATASPAADATPSAAPSPAPSPSSAAAVPAADELAGSTGFSDVLGSVIGERSGTPEQYATLMALVARDLGVPARVATGFRVRGDAGGSTLPAGRYEVTDADAWTWVEIPVVGSGWVVLDAAPDRHGANQPQTASAAPQAPSSSAAPSQNALLTQSNNGHAVAPRSAVPTASTGTNKALVIGLIAIVALIVLAMLLVLVGRKPARAARRRRSPDPRTRVIGAWQETLDVLSEAGLPELSTHTSAEIARLTGDQFGVQSGAEAATLGSAANAAAYSARTMVTAEDAEAAWSRHRVLKKSVARQLDWRQRLAAGLRYHRPEQVRRPVSPASWRASAAAATGPDHVTHSSIDSNARRRPERRHRRAH